MPEEDHKQINTQCISDYKHCTNKQQKQEGLDLLQF